MQGRSSLAEGTMSSTARKGKPVECLGLKRQWHQNFAGVQVRENEGVKRS